MKLTVSTLILCGAITAPAAPPFELSAQQVLDAVIAQLPSEPLHISGDLSVRRRRGVVVRELRFDMFLDWGQAPWRSRYVIRDTFGAELETLQVLRDAGTKTKWEYHSGHHSQPDGRVPLFDPIQGSDLTWTDLSLAFLWWRDGRVVGKESIRGRECLIIEVPAPERAAETHEDEDTAATYSAVRLWIDQELFMMLQAQGLNADSQPLRTLWVKSLKKIDDRWMIKDMEIQAYPSIHRTRLHIREVSVEDSSRRTPALEGRLHRLAAPA